MTSASSTKMLSLLSTFFSLLLFAGAKKHHLFVGTYGTPSIYGVTYDDNVGTLTALQNNTTRSENEWLALSYDSKTLYSSGRTGWSSFQVTDAGELGKEMSTAPAVGQCSIWEGVFILASRRAPYTVYGSLSCANYIGVNADGSVGKATPIPYNEAVVIYGMAMDPSYNYLYSSDWRNGKLWTHKVNADGTLTLIGAVAAPSAVSAPRTIVVHPSGRALYVVLEAWNAIALYTIDASSHLPVYTKALYPLVPEGLFTPYVSR
jgi:carboxy-cis,cis-muconate cyclase